MFEDFCTIKEKQTPRQCSGLTSASTNASTECQIPWTVSRLLTDERIIISYSFREHQCLCRAFPGTTCVGDVVVRCAEALCLQPFGTSSLFCPGWLQWQVKGGPNTL